MSPMSCAQQILNKCNVREKRKMLVAIRSSVLGSLGKIMDAKRMDASSPVFENDGQKLLSILKLKEISSSPLSDRSYVICYCSKSPFIPNLLIFLPFELSKYWVGPFLANPIYDLPQFFKNFLFYIVILKSPYFSTMVMQKPVNI